MAAAALLRSVASKMSRGAAPTQHHRSLVARGLSTAVSGPAANCFQQGTADAMVSAGMASGAGRFTTKIAHHRLVHGRGLHSRASPDPIPSTPPKVLHTTAFAKTSAGVAYIALFGTAIYLHFWVKPAQEKAVAMYDTVCQQRSDLINCLQSVNDAQREMNAKLQSIAYSVSQTPSTLASGHVNTTDQGIEVIDKLGKEEALKKAHSQEPDVERQT